MGTVLSFSPRERRPIYTTHHHGSGTISTSNSQTDFQLHNNYAYEQMNNAKNRENAKPMQYLTVPNQFHIPNGFGSSQVSLEERAADSARILSEKNAIEKNLKKHSLFINVLSWKRLSSSHGKKKLESSGKSKAVNITTSAFRPPALTDQVHPMVAVNDKKKYQQQQIQLVSSNSSKSIIVNTQQPIQQPIQSHSIFYTPGDPKNVLALDLERAAHNANSLHQQKMSLPVRPLHLTQQPTVKADQQQPTPAPRKTIIQVSPSRFSSPSS
jgi:cyclin-dependent kinase 5 activator 1